MSKKEKINRILEMCKEMYELQTENINENELDKLYFQTKIALETLKELKGEDKQ